MSEAAFTGFLERDLRGGKYADTTEIARQFQLNHAYVRRILRFGYLDQVRKFAPQFGGDEPTTVVPLAAKRKIVK